MRTKNENPWICGRDMDEIGHWTTVILAVIIILGLAINIGKSVFIEHGPGFSDHLRYDEFKKLPHRFAVVQAVRYPVYLTMLYASDDKKTERYGETYYFMANVDGWYNALARMGFVLLTLLCVYLINGAPRFWLNMVGIGLWILFCTILIDYMIWDLHQDLSSMFAYQRI